MGRSESHSAPLDRAALAIGSALVAWSERRSARTPQPVDFDEAMIRRAAQQQADRLMSERYAGADYPLWRMF
jgi:hypothetical protein